MEGVININKPLGMTSHDVVGCLRRILDIKRIGHTGTLDPEAAGVLPICVGKATKISELLTAARKQYVAEVCLGVETDTLDASGEVLRTAPVDVSENEIRQCLQSFIGEISQIPPMYSAIKIDGKKLYELAREGKEVKREPRLITIFDIKLLHTDLDKHKFTVRVDCSKGTYIRTLCQDIGESLGCGAHMSALTRTRSGRFFIEDSITLEKVEAKFGRGETDFIQSVSDALPDCPKIVVAERNAWRIRNGIVAEVSGLVEGKSYCVYDEHGDLLSISTQKDGKLKMTKSFYGK